MKRPLNKPPYGYEDLKNSGFTLPVTLAVLGASVVLMAVLLITSEKNNQEGNEVYDVENYDIVGNQPFIYGICE